MDLFYSNRGLIEMMYLDRRLSAKEVQSTLEEFHGFPPMK